MNGGHQNDGDDQGDYYEHKCRTISIDRSSMKNAKAFAFASTPASASESDPKQQKKRQDRRVECGARTSVKLAVQRWSIVVLFLISAFGSRSIKNAEAIPISATWRDRYVQNAESAAFDDDLQTYLSEFGYLPKNNREISNLRSDAAISTALGRLQEYAGLNVTASLDEPTKKLLKSKRCGMSDIPYDGGGGIDPRRTTNSRMKRFTIFGEKWPKSILTYKVVNYSPYMDAGQTRRAVYDAFGLWSDASALEFVEVGDDDADILIEFASGDHNDGYPFDGKNVVLAHAFFPGKGRGGDAHFDLDESWTHLPSSHDYDKVNFYTVAAHEFGHSLGLGHSKDRNSLMFAYYKDFSSAKQLPYDDAIGIQKLYGVGKGGIPEPPSATEPPTPGTDPPTAATYAPPETFTTPIPDTCRSKIDAVARIRNEIFVFRDYYFWRYSEHGLLISNPTEIDRFWHGFPDDLKGIDAVFERPRFETIVFFKGRQYWQFRDNHVLPGYPKSISSLGVPKEIDKIDAAFVWSWTGKPYLFSGNQFWRLNDTDMTVEHGYPRTWTTEDGYWTGVPYNIDAAYANKTGDVYFFKDSEVYKFNDWLVRVENHYPIKMSEFWPQCKMIKENLSFLRFGTSSARLPRLNLGNVMFFIIFLMFRTIEL